MMIQDYRNVIGNEIILVITKRQRQNEDDNDSKIQKCYW